MARFCVIGIEMPWLAVSGGFYEGVEVYARDDADL